MADNPSEPVSALDAHLGYWLRLVSNHVSHAFGRKLEGCGVTVAEWVLMRQLLPHESAAPSRLADELRMTRGAISKLVDRLVAKALVTKAQVEGDRRFQDIALTPAGRALVPDLAALADANDAEFFGHLSADERAALDAILKGIVRWRSLDDVPID
jgi:MarR family transcriptional regulator, lower aerobic nicotinate degradation pathway regulator